jgi:hypothetical protein
MPGELNGKELRSGQGFKERRWDLSVMKSSKVLLLELYLEIWDHV